MARISFQNTTLATAADDTVLDTLLAAGHDIPHSCRTGACQSCLMQATQGPVPASAQKGLKDTLKAQDFFLACQCHPADDLTVRLPGAAELRVPATVVSHALLAPDVLQLRLRPPAGFSYRAGQYLTLWRDARLGRSYSLASVPAIDSDLELHIKTVDNGQFSSWARDTLRPGDSLSVQGPAGDVFYVAGDPDQPLLLIGTGTGAAPLYGIVRDALHLGHTGPIHLFHGALNRQDLYLHRQFQALATGHANFRYHAVALHGEAVDGIRIGSIDALALETVPRLQGWKVFLCGAPPLVHGLRKKVFLAGASAKDIHTDAFVPAAASRRTAA